MSSTLPEVSISLTDLARQPEFALVDLRSANQSLTDAVQSVLSASSQVRFHQHDEADSMLREVVSTLRRVSSLIEAAEREAHEKVSISTEQRMRREAFEAFVKGA